MDINITRCFLLLIRLGLDTIDVKEKSCTDLLSLSMKELDGLMDLAMRQGVAAIAFDGVQRLFEVYGNEFKAAKESPEKWLQWVLECTGMMTQYEQRSQLQKKVIEDLAGIWASADIKMMVFKGQANAAFYPVSNHRATGDIDCWLFGEAEKGDYIMERYGVVVDNSWYRHSKVFFHGETIENHRMMSHTRGGNKRKEMEEKLRILAQQCKRENGRCQKEIGGVFFPSAQFNACFLTYHGLHHFISEGLRMKQILDWAMFLQKEQNKVDWPQYNGFCKRYKLDRFAGVMNYIAFEYLGVPLNNPEINVDCTYAERVLQSTLYNDDYLFNSSKDDWVVRWLLVKNMLKRDKWKYQYFAQQNVWKQLLQNAKGFVFDRN